MKRILIIAALVATIAVPFVLRPRQAAGRREADDTLVIVSPHNGAIRREFEVGFQQWYLARTGRTVAVDWRIVGGTSDIDRFLEGQYTASFRILWTEGLGRPWSAAVEAGFQNGSLPGDAPALVKQARAAFLRSDAGCGIDLFFGGGAYDFGKQAAAGRVVDSGIRAMHPEWFTDAAIPEIYGGERYRDSEDRWIGATLSSFGIIYNRQALARLGVARPPEQWGDLADPRLAGALALCDPTKSGSMAYAFENMIQQQIARRPGALGGGKAEERAVREGWIEGMRLVQILGANARYFTDSSQKVPIDVSDGNCAAGVCIDFYAREQEEALGRRGAPGRMGFVSPAGGTAYSADPIALLRGAKHRAVAAAFIEYVLSMEGQKLWDFKPGTPGGPREFALRLLPIRRDFYAQASWKPYCADPDVNPFSEQDVFTYHPAWTGGLFREMAFIIRVMCQDNQEDLARAWRAIIAAPEPARSQALAVLQDLSFVDYDRASHEIKQALESKDKVDEVRLSRDLGALFRSRYARAEALARGAR